MFGCEKKKKNIGKLLISNNKNSYSALIKNFNRFMGGKTKHHDKIIFSDITI